MKEKMGEKGTRTLTLMETGRLTKAGLPKIICVDGGCVVQRRLIRLCEGEPSAARLYKPARLCDSRTPSHPIVHVPTPGTLVPTPPSIRRQSILVQSNVPVYLGHGVPSCACPRRRRSHPRSSMNSNLTAKCRRRGCRWDFWVWVYSTGACPWKLPREESRPLIDYLTGGDPPGKRRWSAKWIPLCDEEAIDYYFFFRTRHYTRREREKGASSVLETFRS